MEFKDRIRELRYEAGLTQSQLAAKLEKGEAAIRTWETGRAKPDTDTLIELSKIFDCSIDYLLGISSLKKVSPERELYSDISKITEQIAIKKCETIDIDHKIQEYTGKIKDMETERRLLFTEIEMLETKKSELKSKILKYKETVDKFNSHMFDI